MTGVTKVVRGWEEEKEEEEEEEEKFLRTDERMGPPKVVQEVLADVMNLPLFITMENENICRLNIEI